MFTFSKFAHCNYKYSRKTAFSIYVWNSINMGSFPMGVVDIIDTELLKFMTDFLAYIQCYLVHGCL